MFASPLKTIICLGVMGTLFTGCATKTLMTKDNKSYTRTNKVTLIEDQVVAFGKPAQPLPNLPAHSLVIAGQQKSYVLTQGGPQFVSLIGKLEPKNIQVTRELSFYSEKNDGHFTGTLPLSYVKLKEDISKKDLDFLLKMARRNVQVPVMNACLHSVSVLRSNWQVWSTLPRTI